MTPAPVGLRCPDHAGKARTFKAPRIVARPTGEATATRALVAINVGIYLLTIVQGPGGINNPGGSLFTDWVLFGPAVASGDWWRLGTAMFLHFSLMHIAFNMLALWSIGTFVEQYLGRSRFLLLYLVSGLAGSAGALLQSPGGLIAGASGAVFGILGAMLILEWNATGQLAGQAASWIALNLVLSFVIPGISWGGHVGGLIGGILVMLTFARWGRGQAVYGRLGIPGALGLAVVAAGSVALAYWKVRGYA
jgi:membrane associated rhomboid family serine protease